MSPVESVPNIRSLAEVFDCEVKQLPIIYLGLPLGAKASLSVVWNPII